jgi:hypothetical protein
MNNANENIKIEFAGTRTEIVNYDNIDYLFQIYESSLVYWCIFFGSIGIIYYSIIIYLKIKLGDIWKDGIIKWILKWYLDETQKKIQLTKNTKILTPIFEQIKKHMDIN